tara:strand:+ start:353 stop:718 length:366 start_codon:yes stop_codon:yes gene_type:complete
MKKWQKILTGIGIGLTITAIVLLTVYLTKKWSKDNTIDTYKADKELYLQTIDSLNNEVFDLQTKLQSIDKKDTIYIERKKEIYKNINGIKTKYDGARADLSTSSFAKKAKNVAAYIKENNE